MKKIIYRNILLIFALCFVSGAVSAQSFENVECEDTCSHIHGIDISHHQREVFWETLGENTKMSYVYVKATEGGNHVDTRYVENVRLAHVHGLKVGSYHFFRPKTDVSLQLQNFRSMCLPSQQDLIPMVDVEVKQGMSTESFCDSLFKFLDLVEEAYGQKPLIYTGTNFYNKNLAGKLGGYKLMIAQYNDQEPVLYDDNDYIIWQYTGKGHIKGVNGYVDKSRFMGRHGMREIRYRR